jgi:hypothetical protein
LQLPGLLADPNAEFVPSSFFSEQLTAFELWLAHGSADKKPPEQLPIVLQVSYLGLTSGQSASCNSWPTTHNKVCVPRLEKLKY